MNKAAFSSPIEILLIDDNVADVRLTVEALRESGIDHRLSVARNGLEAMAFLNREAAFPDAPRPDLILLDLNLPGKDGLEVLAEIKQHPELKAIPVVVLTTSADARDVHSSYQLHANAYMIKPVDFDRFVVAMRSIEDFWLRQVRLPPSSP
jgi:CheY-like chemotaxis protein